MRKGCPTNNAWGRSSNGYSESFINSWMNEEYKARLSPTLQAMIGRTKFYYTPGKDSWTVGTFQAPVFPLSLYELGGSYRTNSEGSTLPIAQILQIARLDSSGAATRQWSRSPAINRFDEVGWATSSGGFSAATIDKNGAYRPCFTLPADAFIDADLNLVES